MSDTEKEKSTSLESKLLGETPPPETSFDTSGAKISDAEAKNWCLFAHLSALSGLVGVPFGSILGPLIIWLIKKNEHPAVDYHGKEALNFNITVLIAGIACLPFFLIFIGFFMLIALMIFWVVMVIMATIKVSNGEPWRYPFTLRLIS